MEFETVGRVLCSNGCGFFGSEQPPHLCSICSHRKQDDAVRQACAELEHKGGGFTILTKLLGNIATNSDVARFRKMRLSNPSIATVWSDAKLKAILQAVGFITTEDGDHVELPKHNYTHAKLACQVLGIALPEEQSHGHPTETSEGRPAAARPGKLSLQSRPSVCALCSRDVFKYNWAPGGSFFIQARASWEGVVCETCSTSSSPSWFVICGQCFNDTCFHGKHAHDHVFGAMGYTDADQEEDGFAGGFRGVLPPPPPPNRGNRRGPWG